MSVYLSCILLGISLAAPIGPVNAAQLDKGIRLGFFHAWLVGLGAMVADAVFMLLIFFGFAHFLDTPFMKTFLWCFGCLVLIYSGVDSIRNTPSIQSNAKDADASKLKSFYSGFFMTLSNPLSILFWIGIYGSVLAKTAETYATWDLLIFSSGIFVGLLVWDVAMAAASSFFRNFFHSKAIAWISKAAGVSLIGFGLFFGWQALRLLIMRL